MIAGKNGDVLIEEVDLENKTMTVTSGGKEVDGGFYIQPEGVAHTVINSKGHIGYMQVSPMFYMSSYNNDFYLQYAGSAYNYKPPTIEEKIEEKIQMGYQEVVPKWYVHKNAGDILHLCFKEEVQGYPEDLYQALVLNKDWHNHNVICSKCHQPAPSKVFFLSEAVK